MINELNILNKNEINDFLSNPSKGGYICCLNANTLSHAYSYTTYLNILKKSYGNICDGYWISKIIRLFKSNIELIPGPDLFVETLKNNNYNHVLLGSNIQILNDLENSMFSNKIISNKLLKIPLPYKNVYEFDYEDIIIKLEREPCNIIWISLGAPKQEIFASILYDKMKDRSELKFKKMICVGAAFDFYSNSSINRSPKFLRKIGLEWFWRLLKQPKKTFKRLKKEFITLPKIIYKEIITK